MKKTIVIRMTEAEYDALVVKCLDLNCSMNTFVRSKILDVADEKIVGTVKRKGKPLKDPRKENNHASNSNQRN